jgi:hypothetical protein
MNEADNNLTLEQKATNFETMRHIERVRNLLCIVIDQIQVRGIMHDQSKLMTPEVEAFTEFTGKLAKSTYGSAEYNAFREAMKPALDHHYARNRHHPEHHKAGINDMNLVDLVEMLCDWKAASERHDNGNILKSIETNASRFDLTPQLVRILENTAKYLFGAA